MSFCSERLSLFILERQFGRECKKVRVSLNGINGLEFLEDFVRIQRVVAFILNLCKKFVDNVNEALYENCFLLIECMRLIKIQYVFDKKSDNVEMIV